MRKEERGEERDTTTHLIKFQLFTHASRVTNFSTFSLVQVQLMACASLSSARRINRAFEASFVHVEMLVKSPCW